MAVYISSCMLVSERLFINFTIIIAPVTSPYDSATQIFYISQILTAQAMPDAATLRLIRPIEVGGLSVFQHICSMGNQKLRFRGL